MSDFERPPLDQYTFEKIDQSLYEVDQVHWSLIAEMRVKKYYPLDSPVPPPRREHLRHLIEWYADRLFKTEADQYDQFRPDGRYPAWLSRLTDRVVMRVLTAIERLEEADSKTLILGYHGLSRPEVEQDLQKMLWNTAKRYEQGNAPSLISSEPAKEQRQPKRETTNTPPQESLAAQIKRLQNECNITAEKMAEVLEIVPRSVYKHLAGQTIPRRNHIAAYENLFSELLKRPVTLKKVSKRSPESQ